MQQRDDTRFSIVTMSKRCAASFRQRLVPQHATLDEINDVEGSTENRLVLAQRVRPPTPGPAECSAG